MENARFQAGFDYSPLRANQLQVNRRKHRSIQELVRKKIFANQR